jgi:2-keto-4-pentenoate hydratase/2-oxohepta-3-ene-1,7-dioic acid hydratase in catechol pathway
MRLVTYDAGAGPAAGVLEDEEIVPLGADSMRDLLAAGLDTAGESVGDRVPLDAVTLLPPVPDPEKIVCLGLNYRDHAEEAGQEVPAAPLWFAKFANSLIGPGAPIVLPDAHPEYVDYEAELAVVIGRDGQVVGAMAFNDVSARDLQLQNPLWTSGKAIDTFAPCGPALVTLDEIGDLQDVRLWTRVNGEVVQEGTTADQVFGVAEVVDWLARTMTLRPGDIVATGTPAGVGAMQGRFLRDGDVVEVGAEGLGAIANPVRRA